MPKGYTNKDAIEKYLLITIDSSFDAQVDEWIEGVEEMIDAETGRDFAVFAEDGDPSERVYDGSGTNTLYIGPVSEVVSLKFDPDGDEIDPDQYKVYPANGAYKDRIVLPYLVFPKGFQNIVVEAEFGAVSVKKDIKLAATILVAGIINFAWSSGSEIQSLTMGRYSVTYKTPKQEQDFLSVQGILDRNKRYTF